MEQTITQPHTPRWTIDEPENELHVIRCRHRNSNLIFIVKLLQHLEIRVVTMQLFAAWPSPTTDADFSKSGQSRRSSGSWGERMPYYHCNTTDMAAPRQICSNSLL